MGRFVINNKKKESLHNHIKRRSQIEHLVYDWEVMKA